MNRMHHILVVEDSDEDFETVLDAAQRAGVTHEIRRATTGDEGLRLLHESAQNQNTIPALVLLDLNTPNDDGRHALREIKQDDLLRAIPLVVLSTSANPRDLTFCYASGANAYHVKPVEHAVHLQVLEQIFSYWLTSVVLCK
jgi:two-component system, response regulator